MGSGRNYEEERRDCDDDDGSRRGRDHDKSRKRKADRSRSRDTSPRGSGSRSREARGMVAVPKMPALDPKNYWWSGNTAFLQYYIEKWRRLLDPRNYSAAQAVNFMLQCVPEDRKYIINDCSSLEDMLRKLSTYTSDEGTYLLKMVHKLKSHNKSQAYHEDKRLLEFFDKGLADITKLNSAYTLDYFTAQVMINKLSSDTMRSKYLDKLKDLMVDTNDAHNVDNYLVTMQQIVVKARGEINMIIDVNQGDLSEKVEETPVYNTQVYERGDDSRRSFNDYRSDQRNGIQRGIRGSNQGHESGQREGKGKEHGSRYTERGHCMVCKEQGHINLLHCSKLPEYIPRGSNIKQIPRELCKSCLSTIDCATKCIHKWPRNYNDWMCQQSKANFILCKDCQKHQAPQDWLKENFNPHIGLENLFKVWKNFNWDNTIIN